MAGEEKKGVGVAEEFVYRISTSQEWENLQTVGHTYGGELEKSAGFIHLSDLNQGKLHLHSFIKVLKWQEKSIGKVKQVLQNFFQNTKTELYLLQIDAKKLGDGLIYEVVDGVNSFPHFYGPSRSFSPLPLDAVTKAEKLTLSGGQFTCSFLE